MARREVEGGGGAAVRAAGNVTGAGQAGWVRRDEVQSLGVCPPPY